MTLPASGKAYILAGMTSVLLGLVTSCTDSSSSSSTSGAALTSGNRPPSITSAKFLHDPLSLTEPVAVQIYAEDPEREAVAFHYQWYVDGVPLDRQTNATLPSGLLRRGQKVSVEIVPADGTQKGAPYRVGPVTVGNTPPAVTRIAFDPETPQPGARLNAQVEAHDPDHDRVDLTYRWFRNNGLVKEGEEPFLDTKGFAGRDKIAVEVVPADATAKGKAVRSDELTLGNSPPHIVSTPPMPGMHEHFEYQVRATDPDGDRLTYHLETSPSGMVIDEVTGHVVWSVPAGQQGTFHVKVVAKDGQGGAAYQEFDLTLSAQLPDKPAGA